MNINVEKFSVTELSVLRNELLQNGLDSWQAAELFQGCELISVRVRESEPEYAPRCSSSIPFAPNENVIGIGCRDEWLGGRFGTQVYADGSRGQPEGTIQERAFLHKLVPIPFVI